MSRVFDTRSCQLGEGPLWHPLRHQLFWFDILSKQLMARAGNDILCWQFDNHVSAAGWISRDELLIASDQELFRFNLIDGSEISVIPLESGNSVTRSNDGRADPWGGFWIGTMGKNAEPDAGSIYRFYRGELRLLFSPLTIANGICFSPDRRHAYFTDTPTQKIMRQPLEAKTGWPNGEPSVFLDLTDTSSYPDGAVADAKGNLWIALWGSGQVAVYDPVGRFLRTVAFDAQQTTCPAFGGPDLTSLFCTSAVVGLTADTIASQPSNGMTFCAADLGPGQAEHQILF